MVTPIRLTRHVQILASLLIALSLHQGNVLHGCGGTDGKIFGDDQARANAALEKRISFDFAKTPVADVLAFFACLSDLTFVIDPKVSSGSESITLMVTDMHVRSALNWVTRLAGLKYAVWGRVVFVSNSDRIAQGLPIIPPSLGKRTRRKLDQRVSFDFVDTPVSDVARFLKELTGVDVRADPRSDPEKINVTLKLADIPLAEAIAWVALVADMQIKTKGWSTLVLARKAQAGAGAQR